MDKLRINSFGRLAAHDVAAAKGFYETEGLEVEHAATQASKTQMQEAKDGVWHFVHTHADNVFWWNEDNGADLLIVLAIPSEPNLIFVVSPEIKSYEDLRGKTIAADAAESGFVTSLRVMMKEHGLAEEGKDYYFEEIGSNRVDALREGRFPASMLNVGAERALEAQGFHVLDSITRLYNNYATIAAGRRQWIQENEDTVVRYLRAHTRALVWMQDPANAAEAAQLDIRYRVEGGISGPPPFAWEGIREMMGTRKDAGLLRGPVDPKRMADDRYYLEAVKSLGFAVS
jgi:ABC-type nitrate/sulfonate/bicarbonate transport system substrate-binding protein